MQVMGIDGGGSKTYAVIVDETGKRLGSAVAGCGNHESGLQEAMTEIRRAGEEAMRVAGVTFDELDFVQYGLAGADRPQDFAILRPALSQLPWKRWDVVCDTMTGLRVGSPENIGVVAICGSGCNSAGRHFSGKTAQTGGFGYLAGDAAGGDTLAKEAFRAAIRAWEQREEPTVLQTMVPAHLGYPDVEAMWNDALDRDLQEVPLSLCKVLHEAADIGDSVAIRILSTMGQEYGISVHSVILRMGGFEGIEVPVVLSGSVFQKGQNPHLIGAMKAELDRWGHRYRVVIPTMEPVYGAVLLAFDHLGLQANEEMMAQFSAYGGYENEERSA